MTARLHRMKEEHEREPGWLQGFGVTPERDDLKLRS